MSSTDHQTATPEGPPPAEPETPEVLQLAAEFPTASRAQWRDLVAGVLRKAGREELPDPVEDALRRTVATGVTVAPLYTAEDADDLPVLAGVPGLPPFVRGSRAGAPPSGPRAPGGGGRGRPGRRCRWIAGGGGGDGPRWLGRPATARRPRR